MKTKATRTGPKWNAAGDGADLHRAAIGRVVAHLRAAAVARWHGTPAMPVAAPVRETPTLRVVKPAPSPVPHAPAKHTCGSCGKPGHNARSCGRAPRSQAATTPARASRSSTEDDEEPDPAPGRLLTMEDEVRLTAFIERSEVAAWDRVMADPVALEIARAAAAPARPASAKAWRALDLDRRCLDQVVRELGPAADRDLVRYAQRALRARSVFVMRNQGLVWTMAQRYLWSSLPITDLMQEGNLGLMHAVPRFDRKRGLRFSTYACWWIRHGLVRAVENLGQTVRVPVHLQESAKALRKTAARLASTLGREPTTDELAAAARLPVRKVERIRQSLQPQDVADADAMIGRVPDTTASPSDRLVALETTAQLRGFIEQLPRRERDVLMERFGVGADTDDVTTFREVGDRRGLSRERIRQIENAGLRKLRSMFREAESTQ